MTDSTLESVEERASSRLISKYSESSRLQAMMAAPKGRFESGVHERWSGDLPIRCVSCGSVHLYGQGGDTRCQDCLTPLPLDVSVPVAKTAFVLSLEGEFVSADSAWESITVSKLRDARGRNWIHRIDPSVFLALHEAWPQLRTPGGKLLQTVALATGVGARRQAELQVVNVGDYLAGELSLMSPEPGTAKPDKKRKPGFALFWGALLTLILMGVMWVRWTVAPKSEAAIVAQTPEEARGALYPTASLDAAVHLVKQFHAATTVEEKSPFILSFPTLERDLGFHYAVHGNEPSSVEEFTRRGFQRIGDRLFCAVQGRYPRGGSFLAMVEVKGGQPMRLDWQAFKGSGEMPWRDFLGNTPTHQVTMRLLAKPDDYYGRGIEDDGEFACYRLEDIEGAVPCYGYVRRRTEAGRQLNEFFGIKPDTRAMHGPFQASIASTRPVVAVPKRVTLKVSAFPGKQRADEDEVVVMINELVHVDWVGPAVTRDVGSELAMSNRY